MQDIEAITKRIILIGTGKILLDGDIPYALVQLYPLKYLTGRSDNVFYIFLPLAALLFLVPCYALWRFGVRKYKSSGS